MSPSGGDTTVVDQPITWSPGTAGCAPPRRSTWLEMWPRCGGTRCGTRRRPARAVAHHDVGDEVPISRLGLLTRRRPADPAGPPHPARRTAPSPVPASIGWGPNPWWELPSPPPTAAPASGPRGVGDQDVRHRSTVERREQGVDVGGQVRAGVDDGHLGPRRPRRSPFPAVYLLGLSATTRTTRRRPPPARRTAGRTRSGTSGPRHHGTTDGDQSGSAGRPHGVTTGRRPETVLASPDGPASPPPPPR